MGVIYFFSSTEMLMLGVMLFASIFLAADTAIKIILAILNILLIIFIIKAFIQDVVMGIFKQKNNVVFMLLCMVNDALRMYIFFRLMFELAKEYESAVGISTFSSAFDFIAAFVIGGVIFIIGDFFSIINGLKTRGMGNIVRSIITVWVPTIILGLFYMWCQ